LINFYISSNLYSLLELPVSLKIYDCVSGNAKKEIINKVTEVNYTIDEKFNFLEQYKLLYNVMKNIRK